MGKVAWVFPGQGAQFVGMGKDIAETFPQGAEVFAEADKVLGYRLSEICFSGPETELRITYNTQPALLTVSTAILTVLRQKEMPVDFVAGHSLGEYSALVAAGVCTFAQAVQLVRLRGEWMEEAVPSGQGGMAAVLGMERDQLQQVCDEVSSAGEPVDLANLNCPGQIVISGSAQGVKLAGELAKKRGARRFLPLEVSGPFHSRLMRPAAERLAIPLQETELQDARIPVVANVSAQPLLDREEIREALLAQVASPVLWEDSVAWMIEQGVDTFVEIGSGNVLSGLIKKVERSVTTLSVSDVASIGQAWEFFGRT